MVASSKISATPVYRLCAALQLSHIHFNGADLQYQAQPTDRCGAASGTKQTLMLYFLSEHIQLPFSLVDQGLQPVVLRLW